jgi:hypothetical protein
VFTVLEFLFDLFFPWPSGSGSSSSYRPGKPHILAAQIIVTLICLCALVAATVYIASLL